MSRLASTSFDPYDCVNEPSSSSKPFAQTSVRILSRMTRQRSTGPSSPCVSTERTARSNATHAITFECTKWRGSPRISQMPLSGSVPDLLEIVEEDTLQRPGRLLDRKPVDARLVQRIHQLAEDVDLQLIARGVADPHRLRALVPREPGQLELRQPALAGDAVHDLDVRRIARDRAQEPAAPLLRFVDVAAVQQREQRQRRVAEPAVAVVPVAHASDPLRQRRRRRSDDAAGRRVGQRLQEHERAADDAAQLGRKRRRRRRRATPARRSRSRRAPPRGRSPPASSSCDGNHVSTNGTRSPSSTTNSEIVRMFSPCVDAGVRKHSPSGPAIARRAPSARRTHGTMLP